MSSEVSMSTAPSVYGQPVVSMTALTSVSGPPPARPTGQVLKLALQTAGHVCPHCGEWCNG